MHHENVIEVNLPLCEFDAWRRTRGDLEVAIAAGPGVVALVGPGGSGKTSTMAAFAFSSPDGRARLRSPGQPVGADVTVDMVDGVDPAMAARLDGEPPFAGTRVAAMLPETLAGVLAAHPDARIVRMRPMEDADVRAMMEARRVQLRLPRDIFTFKAMSNLSRLCGGNPGTLDRLFGGAAIAAGAGMSRRLSGEHVEESGRRLAGAPIRPPSADLGAGRAATGPMPAGAASPLLPFPPRTHPPEAVSVPVAARAAADPVPDPAGSGGGSAWDVLRGGTGAAGAVTGADGAAMAAPRPRRRATILSAALASGAAVLAVFGHLPARAPWDAVHGGTARKATAGIISVVPLPPLSEASSAGSGGFPGPGNSGGWQSAVSPAAQMPDAAAEFAHGGSLRLPRAGDSMPASIGLADPRASADNPAVLAAILAGLRAERAGDLPRPRDPANAARLLALGRVLASIGQAGDAKAILTVSAEMGSTEATAAVRDLALAD